jgi:hypothetical protein
MALEKPASRGLETMYLPASERAWLLGDSEGRGQRPPPEGW